ncbi:MAG TPA: hypothetical protein VGD72_05835 [Mycobacteriales bacterium]|jgi:hypothetical protein
MFGKNRTTGSGDFVFPDWSPYRSLDDAAKAYLRDADLALDDIEAVLGDRQIAGFTLERVVMDDGRVWQEAAVCDGERLLLWHGEDVPDDGKGAMTSAVRTIPLSSISEVGCRRHVERDDAGATTVTDVEVYALLRTIDESEETVTDEGAGSVFRHDAVRFGKNLQDVGPGQLERLSSFARLLSTLLGKTGAGIVDRDPTRPV